MNEKNIRNKHLVVLLVLNFMLIFLINEISKLIFGNIAIDNGQDAFEKTSTIILLLPWLIGPLKEELKYRWILGQFSYNATIGSLSILLSDLILTITLKTLVDKTVLYFNYYFFLLTLSLLFFLVLKRFQNSFEFTLYKLFSKFYKFIYLGSILIFALWHTLLNDYNQSTPIITMLVIYIINGFIISYIRIQLGLLQAIVYHYLYNLPFMIPFIIYYL